MKMHYFKSLKIGKIINDFENLTILTNLKVPYRHRF